MGGQLFAPWILLYLLAIAVMALAYTVLFGLLTVGWLIQKGRFRALPMLVAGLVIGAAPTALWQHPWKRLGTESNAWLKGVQTLENGSLTWAGWLQYFQQTAVVAILGAIGALAFYFVYKDLYPHLAVKP